jgi:hypothetical protein
MLNAGVDKAYRDIILGHAPQGMDVHYLTPPEDELHRAMSPSTARLDTQRQTLAKTLAKPKKNG